jgi:hypothetical protein
MQLTKTQRFLMDQAKSHGGSHSVAFGSGRGPLDGRVCYGRRELSALRGLEKLGLAKITHQLSYRKPNIGHGCVHSTVCYYELTTPLRARLCTPMTVGQAAIAASTVL